MACFPALVAVFLRECAEFDATNGIGTHGAGEDFFGGSGNTGISGCQGRRNESEKGGCEDEKCASHDASSGGEWVRFGIHLTLRMRL